MADYYVFALPVEIFSVIINKTPSLNKYQLTKINKLANTCLHIQLSFQIYFDRPISLGGNNNAFLIIDSPWDLILLQYDKIYIDKLCKNLPEVLGGWSCTVCTSYINGIVFNKPFCECTYDEAIIEIWTQIIKSKQLLDLIKKYNNFDLNESMIIKWTNYWPTYNYNKKNGRLETSEPKFTNNIGSYELRPSFRTHIDNLFISTAYVKDGIDIFSMESASKVGKYVANAIDQRSPLPYIHSRPIIFAPYRALDNILYHLGMPNISMIASIIICLIIIYFVIKKLIIRQ